MPFRSKAQARKFGQLVREGKISQETFDQWASETPNMKKLPERVKKKKTKKSGFDKGFKKVAENLAEQSLLEATTYNQDRVPGTDIRDNAETGQARGRATRTFNVRNEDKQFGKQFKVKYDSSRGRRSHVS
jgi:hypothetical protein